MRYGENADKVIEAVKEKMKEVEKGLPEGVTFKTSYDRSTLIEEAVESVKGTLIEEMIAVSIVVLIFLFHWRSALIILIQLPISVAVGFIFLEMFGISSNIMSLTGIALAIGVVVDDGIVMVENAYRHISEAQDIKNLTMHRNKVMNHGLNWFKQKIKIPVNMSRRNDMDIIEKVIQTGWPWCILFNHHCNYFFSSGISC